MATAEMTNEQAQEIVDAIAGGQGGALAELKPSRTEVKAAIEVTRKVTLAKAARTSPAMGARGLMTDGQREHMRTLKDCAELYFDREGI
jgi:hypothetical protein